MTSDSEYSIWQDTSGPSYQLANLEEPMNFRMPMGGQVQNDDQPDWVNPETDWSNYQNATLIGWLQQVYHNEAGQNDRHVAVRSNWVRENDDQNAYRYTDGTSIIDMLDKEGATYVQDLLYTNTSEYDLNVSGPSKTIGKFSQGAPITNFFIKDHTGTDLGVHKTSGDTSAYFAVGTSSDTEISVGDGTLADHSVVPRYGAGTFVTKGKLPRLNIPTKTQLPATQSQISPLHKDVDLQTSLVDDAIVILAPTDQLTLGIQNSISTTFASQQIKGGSNDFVRWGRTSLKIPAQDSTTTNSYLRLYVKKVRSDKDFNIVADSSNYNQNVNRDLGDHANADQFITSNTTIYSGSMADDIIGPTVFTEPVSRITVDSSLGGNNIAFVPGRDQWVKLSTMMQDLNNFYEAEAQVYYGRPNWRRVGMYLLDSTMATHLNSERRNFDWLFSTYNASEIENAIQNVEHTDDTGHPGYPGVGSSPYPGGGARGQDYRTTTLEDLGIPVSNLEIPWTALTQNVFDYGGPFPADINKYYMFGGDIRHIFQGFLT